MAEVRYRIIFALSFLALLWERGWSAFWPAVSAGAVYAALCLAGVPAAWGPAWHAALFGVAAIAIVLGLARRFRFPRAAEVERRMEAESALSHRPLSALHDRPAGAPDAGALALWETHVRALANAKNQLKIIRPLPDTARQDPLGLRHAALILLVIGLAVAGNDAGTRLRAGVQPRLAIPALSAQKAEADIWIAPPKYTHLAPVFLASPRKGAALAGASVETAAHGILKVRVNKSARPPRLRYAGEAYPLARVSKDGYAADIPLKTSGTLRLRQGVRELGVWHITVKPDAAPHLEITAIDKTPQESLKITYAAEDDYGIVKMTGTVTAPGGVTADEGGAPVAFDMAPGTNPFTVDLTSHLRAGEAALLSLSATDGAGNAMTTVPKLFTLPVRAFRNALARRLVAERRNLVFAKDDAQLKAAAESIAEAGSDLSLYKGDTGVFLAIGSAARRLVYDGSPDAVRSVQDTLWDVALKIEDGGLTTAARELSEALQELSRALADKNTPKEELQNLADAAQKKMQAYMQTLLNEMAQQLRDQKNMPLLRPEIAKKFMKTVDLADLMRQMQQLSAGDSREAMKKMAEFLKKAVDNLDPARMQQMKKEQMQAMEALQDMDDIIRRQQALLDKTGRLGPKDPGAAEAQEQDYLRAKLGDTVRKLSEAVKETPDNLAQADKAMKESQGAFRKGTPRESLGPQKEALNQLQKAMDAAAESLAKTMQQTVLSFGLSPGGGQGEGFGDGFDPLGRGNADDSGKGGDIKIPDEKERRRVQQIIDELRNRSNDWQRPKVERDYLDRLLDQMN